MRIKKFNHQKNYGRLFCMTAMLLAVLTSCNNQGGKVSSSGNDTTRVIELAIKTVLEEDFPDAPAMKRIGKYNDSIYFTTNLLLASSLPQRVDSIRLKILPDTLVCSIMKPDTASGELPNYIKLDLFEKRDSGYFVKLESLNCLAGAEAGSLAIFIVKSKDNFAFKK